jgi:hypothetical protein
MKIDIAWHVDRDGGYRFASCYVRGAFCRSYLRGDVPAQYPLPVPIPTQTENHDETANSI